MKNLAALMLAAGCLGCGLAAHATDVGVSITVGQPGFFGRIDLGSAPAPELVYAAPVVAVRPPSPLVVAAPLPPPAPLYLHVPPGHEKHWRKHCREYNACGVPVYFVGDRWYNDVYVKHYQEHHDHGHGDYRDDDRGHGKHHGHGQDRD